MYQVGFIGCGNMGSALVAAAAKTIAGEQIAVCDHNAHKLSPLQTAYGVQITTAEDIAKNARFVVLGVKPQSMAQTLAPLQSALAQNPNVILVSMAVGLTIGNIQACAGCQYPTIRCMPNTPCMVGAGTVLYAVDGVQQQSEIDFLNVFSGAGKFFLMSEEQIDCAGALSGCGPAFYYLFANGLVQGAKACGVDEAQALQLAAQTMLGAAEMLLEFGDPITLKNNVCSPGGTTLAGVTALEKGELEQVAAAAVTSAYERTLQLKK